jgi:hypothetical protein
MSNHRHPGEMDLGGRKRPGLWLSKRGRSPRNHQNAIEFRLATKTEEASCSEYQQRIRRD